VEKRLSKDSPLGFNRYDGNCPSFNYLIVDSPQDVNSLTHGEIVETILIFSQE